jgi:hypothetical protein
MPRTAQLQFAALKDFTQTRHGGGERVGRRKIARPVATRRPMHDTMRSTKATGRYSMLRPLCCAEISAIVARFADKNRVRVLRFANVGNHLHLVVQAKTRAGFQNYLRTIAGLIARAATGAVKGRASGKFWDELAFSRVLAWGRDLKRSLVYVLSNALEGLRVPTRRRPVEGFRARVYGVP